MEGRAQFLPPKPAGPEPELGPRPAPREPEPPPPPQQSYAPPAYAIAQEPYPYQQAWGPRPVQPDNGPAVAGFVISLVSVSLLLVSAGLSTLISLGGSIFGIVYSRKGKRKVQSGETAKNAGLAQAGFIVGIVALCLSALATVIWSLVLAAAIADDDFRRDLEREFDNSETIRAALHVGAGLGRLLVT
jgi:hypothetical protein